MEQLIQKGFSSLIDWGPGMLIAALMLYGLFRLIKSIGIKIVEALEKPSGALSQQANSMDRLTNAIHNYIERDLSEHREIILLQKIILNKVEKLSLRGEKDDGSQKREI
jgi:hypothetical protein